tara:strand:- start:1070 stop:1633 length:564 start_codon:yes stop_codon:yes gene_type:complete
LKILPTFTEQNQGICTIQIRKDGIDELEHLEEIWNDPEYLLGFFTDQKNNLANGIYSKYTIREAVLKTIEDSSILFDQLYDIAEKGFTDPNDNLSQLFYPLHDGDKKQLQPYEQCKAYGIKIKDGWLRLYAIRIDHNTFVITGGGIKLVRTMQEDKLLEEELQKLKDTQQYLIENNLLDVDDIVQQS